MKFKLFKTEVKVTFLFAATLSLMIATDRTGLILPTLFAVFIHEAGHLFAMWAADCAPKEIRLIPAAVEITEGVARAKGAGIWIIICGPLANLAVSAALFVNYYLSGSDISLKVALLNLVLALFNLLPVSGLDGGRLLCAAICRKRDIYFAERTVRLVTAAVAALIFFCGAFLILRGNANPSVFIVALYLAVCAIIKR